MGVTTVCQGGLTLEVHQQISVSSWTQNLESPPLWPLTRRGQPLMI